MIKGFLRVCACTPSTSAGNCAYNAQQIIEEINKAKEKDINVLVFPAFAICGGNIGEIFNDRTFKQKLALAIEDIINHSINCPNILLVFGSPIYENGNAYIGGYAVKNGEILGRFYQKNLSNYHKKWFVSAHESATLTLKCSDGSITICSNEDLFEYSIKKVGIVLCPSWFYATATSYSNLKTAVCALSQRESCAVVAVNAGFGESTGNGVCAGDGLIVANGKVLCEATRFSYIPQQIISDIDMLTLQNNADSNGVKIEFSSVCDNNYTHIERNPFLPSDERLAYERCNEIFNIQTMALAKRLCHVKSDGIILGVSGGLDSTLALLVAVETAKKLGRDISTVWGITMPGYGTGDRTYNNALLLMKALGITTREISIKAACESHFKDIGHSEKNDITFENAQARERTQILLNMSNKHNLLMLGTGDLSESALGFCTYGGDQFSMYNINASVAKTLMQHMVRWYAKNLASATVKAVLLDIVDTPISPELYESDEKTDIAQKTESIVGPYELHDFFIYYYVKYKLTFDEILTRAEVAFVGTFTKSEIEKWLNVFFKRFFASQFKRTATADSPKIGSVNLSSGEFSIPSDLSWRA